MSERFRDTIDQVWTRGGSSERGAVAPVPGLLLVFSAGEPFLHPIPLRDGALELGRGSFGATVEDACMSRRHAEVTLEGNGFRVRDLGSRNGTALDGGRLRGNDSLPADPGSVVRIGDTLLLLCQDLRAFSGTTVEHRDGALVGPTLRVAWDAIERAGHAGDTLHLHGESGSGKELAARVFHQAAGAARADLAGGKTGAVRGGAAAAPLVSVNCAAIPEQLAERLLFGARKGAYSGAAADAEGYVQAAHGGTLFLDEIAELDLQIQAKLLRVLETHEVTPLGASRSSKVDFRLVSATHRDLRALAGEGKFREDLFFRIGRPRVALPPLRERREEIPWLIHHELSRGERTLVAHVSLVESCLTRQWPGNVRELCAEVKTAAREASAAGRKTVDAARLGQSAGMLLVPAQLRAGTPASVAAVPSRGGLSRPTDPSWGAGEAKAAEGDGPDAGRPEAGRIEDALRDEGGNVSRAARRLGVHRTQLRRWLERFGIDPKRFGAGT